MNAIIIILLLIIPTASATIILDELERDIYNLGDKIFVSGYLIEDKDVWARFQLDLVCDDITTLSLKVFNIKRGAKLDFNEELPLFSSAEKECKIAISVLDGNEEIDKTETSTFKITNELKGNFSVEENIVQVGKEVVINGIISKISEEVVNGIATLFFMQDKKIVFVDNVNIEEGIFVYIYNTKDNLPGDYSVNIEVIEIFGNRYLFENVVKFTLINELSVITGVNKGSILPGTDVTVFGEVNTVLRETVEDGIAIIYFGDGQYETDIKDSRFEYKLKVPEDIKSGKQEIKAVAVDSFGNRGEAQTSLEVIPIPSELKIEFEKRTYLPGDTLKFKAILYDQAGDIINEKINIRFTDSEDNLIDEFDADSNIETEYVFTEGVLPGIWKIRLTNSNLEYVKDFLVGNLAAVDYNVENGVLIVKNIGNVKYTEPINIKIKGNSVDLSLTKKTSIKPTDSLEINLGREVESGVYNVEVGDKVFEDVQIIGSKNGFDLGYLYWPLIFLVLLLIMYVIFFRTKRKILRTIREKKLKAIHHKKKEKTVDEYKKDFMNRMLKQVEERDRRIRKDLRFNIKENRKREGFMILGKEKNKALQKDDDKKDGGLFSMFD